MLNSAENSIVLLVDLQERLMPAIENGTRVVAQAVRLGRIARLLDISVIGTEQRPDRLGNNLQDIRALCSNTVAKNHFDACSDGLIDELPMARSRIVLAGCEAHVCVLQTALGLLDRGLQVTLVSDAVGARKSTDRDAAINRLAKAGAEIATVEMVAFEWLRSSQHPQFRDVLQLIK